MRRKLIAILIRLLALSGLVGIGLAQAGNDTPTQSVEQDDDVGNEEDESSGSDDDGAAEDDDGSGATEDD